MLGVSSVLYVFVAVDIQAMNAIIISSLANQESSRTHRHCAHASPLRRQTSITTNLSLATKLHWSGVKIRRLLAKHVESERLRICCDSEAGIDPSSYVSACQFSYCKVALAFHDATVLDNGGILHHPLRMDLSREALSTTAIRTFLSMQLLSLVATLGCVRKHAGAS
jgi:hypothetical protein